MPCKKLYKEMRNVKDLFHIAAIFLDLGTCLSCEPQATLRFVQFANMEKSVGEV